MIEKRCAVSIDLDAIACYYRIHGLGAAPRELAHVIYERGLVRASRLFAGRGIPVTWFVVGRDVDGEATEMTAPVARAATPDHAFGLDRAARKRNVRGAFTCRRRFAGERVAVVDDVMTTGATLDELARTLKASGAASVANWIVCRTPSDV